MEEQFDFNNELAYKIALVTGGTKGAGKAIAKRLSQAASKAQKAVDYILMEPPF